MGLMIQQITKFTVQQMRRLGEIMDDEERRRREREQGSRAIQLGK